MTKSTHTRRALLTAAIPINALAAIPDEPQSVHALIENHLAADAACCAAVAENERMENSIPKEKRTWYWAVSRPQPPAGCGDDPRWIATQFRVAQAFNQGSRATVDLVTAKPTSLDELSELVRYVRYGNQGKLVDVLCELHVGYDADGHPLYEDCTNLFVESLMGSIDMLAAKQLS